MDKILLLPSREPGENVAVLVSEIIGIYAVPEGCLISLKSEDGLLKSSARFVSAVAALSEAAGYKIADFSALPRVEVADEEEDASAGIGTLFAMMRAIIKEREEKATPAPEPAPDPAPAPEAAYAAPAAEA